jgi:phosphoribosylglycinamide formyltransferase-1
MRTNSATIQSPGANQESFVGEAITPEGQSFSVAPMATGRPGLPRQILWQGRSYSVLEVLEEWKEAGDCYHGSGERYVRKHWFRVRTTGDVEMKLYFERQKRSSGGSRWRLYSLRNTTPSAAPKADSPGAPPAMEA